ncbi:hypothetical protein J3F83DRAFT_503516 [Trichoderma novae-zelandiae]
MAGRLDGWTESDDLVDGERKSLPVPCGISSLPGQGLLAALASPGAEKIRGSSPLLPLPFCRMAPSPRTCTRTSHSRYIACKSTLYLASSSPLRVPGSPGYAASCAGCSCPASVPDPGLDRRILGRLLETRDLSPRKPLDIRAWRAEKRPSQLGQDPFLIRYYKTTAMAIPPCRPGDSKTALRIQKIRQRQDHSRDGGSAITVAENGVTSVNSPNPYWRGESR